MTQPLYRSEPYSRECRTKVTGMTESGGLIVERSVFYPAGGGQPGDSGRLEWAGGVTPITDTVKAGEGLALIVASGSPVPEVGEEVTLLLDWERRHRHMRIHTALHLLSVVLPLPVTGGAISADKGRLDFDMSEPPADKQALEDALNALIMRDLPVSEEWITDAELAANPGLVKTLSVQPPSGQGHIRLIRIGAPGEQVDLQPCGGTHVARTGEIGRVKLGKVEKKGRQNRRVTLLLD